MLFYCNETNFAHLHYSSYIGNEKQVEFSHITYLQNIFLSSVHLNQHRANLLFSSEDLSDFVASPSERKQVLNELFRVLT